MRSYPTWTPLLLLVLACKASSPGGSETLDGGSALQEPDVEAPQSTPLETAAIRGVAFGSAPTRVLIKQKNSTRAYSEPIGQDGKFCVDVDLSSGQTTTFEVRTKDDFGAISPSVDVSVKQDSDAEEPPNPMCASAACPGANEESDCSNGNDDDCDQLVDGCDTDCNQCADDVYLGNRSAHTAKVIAAGGYTMTRCPCLEDWFRFNAEVPGNLTIQASFDNNVIDLDLAFFRSEDLNTPAATSLSSSDAELIEYFAGKGVYLFKVFVVNGGETQTDYDLRINFVPVS